MLQHAEEFFSGGLKTIYWNFHFVLGINKCKLWIANGWLKIKK